MAETAFRHSEAQSVEDRLGPCLDTAKVSRTERARMIAGAIFMPLLPAAFASLAVGASLAKNEPPMSAAAWAGVVLVIGLFGALAAYTVAHAVRFVGSALALHANGIALTSGRRVTVVLWRDVLGWTHDATDVLVAGVPVRTVRVLKLMTRARRIVRLPSVFEDAQGLFSRLEAALTQATLPTARASVEAGLPVPFGPFVVGSDGLTRGRRRVPWNQVGRHVVDRGVLSIETRGAPLTARYAKVPSAPVLRALIDELRCRS